MTGRELIVYILQNHLEDEPVFKDGTFVGFVTDIQAAAMLKTGVATIHTLVDDLKLVEGVYINGMLYIPIEHVTKRNEN